MSSVKAEGGRRGEDAGDTEKNASTPGSGARRVGKQKSTDSNHSHSQNGTGTSTPVHTGRHVSIPLVSSSLAPPPCPLAFLEFTSTDPSHFPTFQEMIHVQQADLEAVPLQKFSTLSSELTLMQSTVLNRTHELQEELRKLEAWIENKHKWEVSVSNVAPEFRALDQKAIDKMDEDSDDAGKSPWQSLDTPPGHRDKKGGKIGRPRRAGTDPIALNDRKLRQSLHRRESIDSRKHDVEDDHLSIGSFVSADVDGYESDDSSMRFRPKSSKAKKKGQEPSQKKRRLKAKLREEEPIDEPPAEVDDDLPFNRPKPVDSHPFWQYFEPYFAAITRDDLANLTAPLHKDEMQDAEIYDVPPLGAQYRLRWALEDKMAQEEAPTPVATTTGRSRRGTDMDPQSAKMPEEDIPITKEEIELQDNSQGPLMHRWLALLVERPPKHPVDTTEPRISVLSEAELERLVPPSGVEARMLDGRIQEEVMALGLLTNDDVPTLERVLYSDEISEEIRQLQAKLKYQIKANNKKRRKLYNRALSAMGRDDFERQLDEVEQAVILAFKKRMQQKKRKQAATKVNAESIRKALQARQMVLERRPKP